MSITLEVNGTPYQNFLSVTITRSMEALSSAFQATATMDRFNNFPIKLGNSVRVLVEGQPVLTGFIEVMEPSLTANTHEVVIRGRDKTADVIDSSLVSAVNFQANIKLRDVVFKLLDGNNIPTKIISENDSIRGFKDGFIGIIDLANPKEFSSGDIVGAEVGQNIFEVIDKYCAKRQVLATTDGNGNIVLTRGSQNQIGAKLITRHAKLSPNLLPSSLNTDSLLIPKTRENNILESNASYSTEGRFRKYIVRSQGNPTSLNTISASIDSNTVVSQSGEATDSDIREERTLVISADTSNTDSSAKDRATWEENVRRVRAFNYNCVVQGFIANKDNKTLWQPNYLVQVEDEKINVIGELLIKSVEYSFSLQGSITKMNMGYKDSFSLEAEQKVRDARADKFGDDVLGDLS